MPINALITDPERNIVAGVDDWYGQLPRALVVATRELNNYSNKLKFFTNETYGYDMNKDFSSGAGLEVIHDGTDSAGWPTTAVAGIWTVDSTTVAHTGSKSIDATATVPNSILQFTRSAAISVESFDGISGWIYITKWSAGKDVFIYGWSVSLNAMVGVRVNLANYVNVSNYGVWQKFVIPRADFSFDKLSFRGFRVIVEGTSPSTTADFYLDDIQLDDAEGSGVAEYTIIPDNGTWLYVHSMNLVIADNYDSTLLNGTMGNWPYDAYLGVSPDAGMVYRRFQNGVIEFATALRHFADWLSSQGGYVAASGFDGTNTFIKIETRADTGILLKSENDDKLSFILADDFSPLLMLRVSAGCKELHLKDHGKSY